MKKIEMIRVRSSLHNVAEIMPSLVKHTEELKMALLEGEVNVMYQSLNKGDIAVFIVWQNARDLQRSREGLMVADALQEIGSITHSVWMEEQDATLHGNC